MIVGDIPLFTELKMRMAYVGDRQKVIAQNVANADTPGYVPQDLAPFSVAATNSHVSTPLAITSTLHMQPPAPAKGIWRTNAAPDSEARLDGNAVVLEDQMIKMADTRMDYDTALGLYQRSLALVRTAARRPTA